MAVSVRLLQEDDPAARGRTLRAGERVPGREQWIFEKELASERTWTTWLIKREAGPELQIVDLAWGEAGLDVLRRKAAVYQRLQTTGKERWRFQQPLGTQLESVPYFFEREWTGDNLFDWVAAQGGLRQIPEQVRIYLMAELAAAVEVAHGAGLIHGDLRPAHIYIQAIEAEWTVVLGGFETWISLTEEGEPDRLPFARDQPVGRTTRVPLENAVYLAPELALGQAPTKATDVYALGVLLYQMMAGSFHEGPLPGWEAEISDPVLRRDIEEAARLNPSSRMSSAANFTMCLRDLSQRRTQAAELQATQERARAAEQSLAQEHAKRPLWWALGVTLSVGLCICLGLFWRTLRERDEARRQASLVAAMNQFLAVDVLSRDNPLIQKGGPAQTLDDAIQAAAANIDTRFRGEPLVAARLHETIARALASQSEFLASDTEYQRAVKSYVEAEGAASQNAMIDQFQRATTLARSSLPGTLPQAQRLFAEQDAVFAKLPHPKPELRMWRAEADGVEAVMQGDAPRSLREMREAVALAEITPAVDGALVLEFRQRLVATEMKRGDPSAAERDARRLTEEAKFSQGPTGPIVLGAKLVLTESLFLQGRYAESIAVADALYPMMVEKLGPANQETLTLLGTRAAAEGEMEYWDRAISDDLQMYHEAESREGIYSYYAVGGLVDAALNECRAGRFNEGTDHIRKALERIARAGEGIRGLKAGASETMAECLVLPAVLGHGTASPEQLHEAQAWLRGIDLESLRQLTSEPVDAIEFWTLQGEINHLQSRDDEARMAASKAGQQRTTGNQGRYERNALKSLEASFKRTQTLSPSASK